RACRPGDTGTAARRAGRRGMAPVPPRKTVSVQRPEKVCVTADRPLTNGKPRSRAIEIRRPGRLDARKNSAMAR
ncbi:hypothetical protein, partial [Burkholderia gladioli]|uniref:hypothetical protein n=1 Tax=Burkholderia gladioli TaxID=28095 RepID=UPI0019D6FEAB